MSRVICWFSCGAASAVATKLALAKYKDREVVIARCIVREEHQDNERFAKDCEEWFDHPITNMIAEEYDGSVYGVITRRKFISGNEGAPCSMLLKKRVREQFELPTDHHVFGYTADKADMDRWDHFLDANNISAESPLIDRGVSHANCLAMIQDAGIELPEMYKLGYQHNNCIGCVKASGAGYWNKIKQDFPEKFWMMAGASRALNAKLVKVTEDKVERRIFLDELKPGVGRYQDEVDIQCGVFCHLAKQEYEA